MRKCLVVVLGLLSGSAVANSACDKPHNDFDGLYCLSKVYQQADADLNTAYQSLSSKLDGAGKAALKHGQLAWMRSRNSSCSEKRGDSFFVDLKCATDATIKRVEFLHDRDRECASSGCQNSRLSAP